MIHLSEYEQLSPENLIRYGQSSPYVLWNDWKVNNKNS